MAPIKFESPRQELDAFTCPHCGVLAQQYRYPMATFRGGGYAAFERPTLRQCGNCREYMLWWDNALVVPSNGGFEPPNADLPEDIRRDFEEGAAIAQRSARGAAALLRLCVQKLCAFLGYEQPKVDDAIAAMVGDGLPVQISQALDVVRVVGNNAVHPGVMDVRDDLELVAQLAGLLNLIADNRISEPKRVQELFSKLPAGTRAAIETRNAKVAPKTKPP